MDAAANSQRCCDNRDHCKMNAERTASIVGCSHPLGDQRSADKTKQKRDEVRDADYHKAFSWHIQRRRGTNPPAEFRRADERKQRWGCGQPNHVLKKYRMRFGSRVRELLKHGCRLEQKPYQHPIGNVSFHIDSRLASSSEYTYT